jgi:hypothetical protein
VKVSPKLTNRGWCKPSTGADYADVSLKQFRSWLRNGLEHSQLPNGRILVKYSAIDRYLEQFGVRNEVKQLAEQLVEDL